jgi:hypothetical protein
VKTLSPPRPCLYVCALRVAQAQPFGKLYRQRVYLLECPMAEPLQLQRTPRFTRRNPTTNGAASSARGLLKASLTWLPNCPITSIKRSWFQVLDQNTNQTSDELSKIRKHNIHPWDSEDHSTKLGNISPNCTIVVQFYYYILIYIHSAWECGQ